MEEQIKPLMNMRQLTTTCQSIISIPDLSPLAFLLEQSNERKNTYSIKNFDNGSPCVTLSVLY